jgi:hypothetical protein
MGLDEQGKATKFQKSKKKAGGEARGQAQANKHSSNWRTSIFLLKFQSESIAQALHIIVKHLANRSACMTNSFRGA